MRPEARRNPLILLCSLLLLAACDGSDDDGNPQPPDIDPTLPDLALEPAFPGLAFAAPILALQAPGDDSHWYVVEKAGVIRVFANDVAAASSEVFLDIRGRVDDGFAESGLLGMAFDPGFPSTPAVYLNYTATGPGGGSPLLSRISRFSSSDGGDTLDPDSEEILLTTLQEASNHNGGHLAFGPDGNLYAAFGDGGGAGDPGENAQDPTNVLGSILRLDVTGGAPYAVPPSNPFAGNVPCPTGASPAGTGCPEIFAWGLRNPWRFSFDRSTGALWAGDVGQDNWEEVDIVVAGGNYGWDEREGAHCYEPPSGCDTSSTDPVTEYDRSIGRSITGGYVYRGNSLPGLDGHYVFADFSSGVLLTIPASGPAPADPVLMLDTDMRFATFAEDLAGELYVVNYNDGTLHRIVAAP